MSNDADFKLLRLILLDSYSPSGEVILNLDQGAILTGENGSGKTSLIRLIPIFYGDNPGHTNFGTSTFSQFYLSRVTSYIIFEYSRRGLTCQAVLYSGDNDTYTYRFVRAPYDLSQYAADDKTTLISCNDLKAHLKTLKVIHSRELTLSEYRAVIQGRLGGGKDAAYQRALVNEYAFTSSGSRLDHIDKIVSGMFRRQAEFRDFLRMVVSYISDQSAPISISGDRAKIGVWPQHFAAYQEVMRHSGLMAEINDREAKLKASDHELSCLHAKMQVLIGHCQQEEIRLSRELERVKEALRQAKEAFDEKLRKMQEKESGAGAQAKAQEKLADKLDELAKEYEGQRIADKAKLVAQQETLKQDLEQLKKRKESLLGEQRNIEIRYDELKIQAEKDYLYLEGQSNGQLRDVEAKYQPLFARLQEVSEAEAVSLRGGSDAKQNETRELRTVAIEQRAHSKSLAANPPADDVTKAALEGKQQALAAARAAQDGLEKARRPLDNKQREALNDFQKQDGKVSALVVKLETQDQVVAKLVAHASPPEGSLIRFLRDNRPDWAFDIAKVIREDLLTATHLAPALTETGAKSLYGVSIDLTRIDSSIYSDEAQLQFEIERQKSMLVDLRRQHEEASAALSRLNHQRESAQAALNDFDTELAKAKSGVQTLETEEKSARALVNESMRKNKDAAEQRAETADRQEKELAKSIDDMQIALNRDLQISRRKFVDLKSDLGTKKADVLSKIESDLTAARTKRDLNLDELDAERRKALSEKGVDVAALARLETRIQTLESDLAEAKTWIERVTGWRHWLKTEWPNRATYLQQAAGLRKQEQGYCVAKEKHFQEWTRHQKEQDIAIQKIERGVFQAHATYVAARAKLVRLEDIPADPTTLALPYDLSWTLDGLAIAQIKLFSDRNIHESDLKSRVREIKRSFRNGRGTATEQYFDVIEANIDPDDDNPRAWVTPLQEWFNGRHHEFLTPLLVEAKTLGRLVERFHTDVTEFDREIKAFNRSIRRALDQTKVFSRISEVSVEFTSTIDQKKYWKPIRDFVETHHAWISSPGNDLPPPTFAEGVTRLMEHWEVKEGIREDRLSLIDVRGQVVENGKLKTFVDGPGLALLSSNGLSYLILITIFVAFINMIRGDAKVQLTWAVDELLDLDTKNISILLAMLRDNNISLVSACPDADIDVLLCFQNRYKVIRNENGPELVEAEMEVLYV